MRRGIVRRRVRDGGPVDLNPSGQNGDADREAPRLASREDVVELGAVKRSEVDAQGAVQKSPAVEDGDLDRRGLERREERDVRPLAS